MPEIHRLQTPENLARMKAVQEQVERAIAPFRENTEAALVCGGIARVMRMLLDQYDERTRRELLLGLVPFLEARDLEEELRREEGHIVHRPLGPLGKIM